MLVAQALVHRPPVIVLDETDSRSRRRTGQTLWQFIQQLNIAGHTILLTTHYLEEAETLCNRIAMLKQGKLIALDSTENFLKAPCRPSHPAATGHSTPGTPLANNWQALGDNRYQVHLSELTQLEPPWPSYGKQALACWIWRSSNRSLEDVFLQVMHKDADMTVFSTLLYKEVLRFWKVSLQTILAPVITALLYLLIFSHVLEDRVQVYEQVRYTAFLLPGLVMMSMLQNAFANSSSSLDPVENHRQYRVHPAAAADSSRILRRLRVGIDDSRHHGRSQCHPAHLLADTLSLLHPLWSLIFAFFGCAMLGTLGLIAGIWADKFDQLAGFQNFLIQPMTFLAGVFYSIHSLPSFWQGLSFQPVLYMIDGFRYGFLGASDIAPMHSRQLLPSTAVLAAFCLHLLKTGYKLRH